MYKAFFDDSGMDAASPVFVMAGYLAKNDAWDKFRDDWQEILDDHTPRKIEYLKAREAFSLRKQFWGFSATERDERLKRFILTTNRHIAHCIVSVVPKAAYYKAFKGRFKTECFDRPYFVSLFRMIVRIHHIVAQYKIDSRVEFIFDSQQDSYNFIREQWPIFYSLLPLSMRHIVSCPPSFEKDEDFAPLQAADLLSWLVRREYYERHKERDAAQQQHHEFLANMLDLEKDHFELLSENEI